MRKLSGTYISYVHLLPAPHKHIYTNTLHTYFLAVMGIFVLGLEWYKYLNYYLFKHCNVK